MKKSITTVEEYINSLPPEQRAFAQFTHVDAEAVSVQTNQFLTGKEVSPNVIASQNSVGKNLIHFRKRSGFTRQEVARITSLAVGAFERGDAVPTIDELFKISTLYGVQHHRIVTRLTRESAVYASCYGLRGNPNCYTIGTLLELYHSGIADQNPFFMSDMRSVIKAMEQETAVSEEMVAA